MCSRFSRVGSREVFEEKLDGKKNAGETREDLEFNAVERCGSCEADCVVDATCIDRIMEQKGGK